MIKRALPTPLASALNNRVVLPLRARWIDHLESRAPAESPGWPIPPALIRFRVHGNFDRRNFTEVGHRVAEDLKTALEQIGRPLTSFRDVLDFGCGCGRTLAWMRQQTQARLSGTDIDVPAIKWCRENLDWGEFFTNSEMPPSPFGPSRFDLIVSVSVFTHLGERYQDAWLAELARVAAPGCILAATVHGPSSWTALSPENRSTVEREGYAFVSAPGWHWLFPPSYQNAYHSPRYVAERFGKYLRVLKYIPQGINGHQDLVLMQKD